jgi:hypothetical protein
MLEVRDEMAKARDRGCGVSRGSPGEMRSAANGCAEALSTVLCRGTNGERGNVMGTTLNHRPYIREELNGPETAHPTSLQLMGRHVA